MSKSVRQRVLDSFQGDGSAAQAKEYSENVYAAWKDISASLSRTVILSFLLMAVFELIVYQHAGTVISIGTVTLGNAPIVQIVLPAIVAFLIFDSCRLTVRWLDLQNAYMELTRISAPIQRDNALDLLITPNLPSMWTIGVIYMGRRPADRFMNFVTWCISFTIIFITPVAFECQAYYRLIQKFGYHNILLWISLVITALIGFSTAIYVRLGPLDGRVT
jgi:hypothetical protein